MLNSLNDTLDREVLSIVSPETTVFVNKNGITIEQLNSIEKSILALNSSMVHKNGDTMTGPLLFESFRTLNQALVSPNGLEVGVGVDGESVAVDKTEYGNGGVTKVEGNEIKSFALPEESGTLVTEETAREIANEEIAKFDFINIVAELPETGLPNRFYLVPKENGTVTDLFDAYIWVINDEYPDGRWEYEGVKSGEIDLTILKDYVKKTDYATDSTAGVARWVNGFGLYVDQYGRGQIRCAQQQEIDEKTQECKPIVPKFLDYAVKVGITTNTETLTDEEKAAAGTFLGSQSNVVNTLVQRKANGCISIKTGTQSNEATTKGYVDDGFVAKNSAAGSIGNSVRYYAVDTTGNVFTVGQNNPGNTGRNCLATYNGGGMLHSETPNSDKAVANKKYVDDGFVAKSTGSADRIMLYGIDEEGNQITVGTSPSAVNNGMVPLYNRSGNINVATPQNGNQAANKYYVDDAVANAGGGGTQLYLHTIGSVYSPLFIITTREQPFTTLLELYTNCPNDYGNIPPAGFVCMFYWGGQTIFTAVAGTPYEPTALEAGPYSFEEGFTDTVTKL